MIVLAAFFLIITARIAIALTHEFEAGPQDETPHQTERKISKISSVFSGEHIWGCYLRDVNFQS